MDADNAHGWLKSARDGIADALCGGQDHGWVWEEPEYTKGARGVTITIRADSPILPGTDRQARVKGDE